MKLLLCVLTTYCLLEVFCLSLPKADKSEGLNEILKTLIRQAENGLDNVKNIAKFNNGEKSTNDSTIIYIKTTIKPNITIKHKASRSKPNSASYYIDNITEEPKNLAEYPDDFGDLYNHTELNQDEISRTASNDTDSNQSIISEEIVFEINPKNTNAEENTINNFGPDDEMLRMKSAMPTDDDYPNNSSPGDNDMLNFHDLPGKGPDFLSNFPGIMTDPEINRDNQKGTEEVVKEMIREFSAMDQLEDRMTDLEKLLVDDKLNNILKDFVKKITSDEINARIGEHITNSSSTLKSGNFNGFDQLAPLQSTHQSPGLFSVTQPRIRTVIHQQAYPVERWPIGQLCCTTYT